MLYMPSSGKSTISWRPMIGIVSTGLLFVNKLSVRRVDDNLFFVMLFYTSDNLCRNTKSVRDCYNITCYFFRNIELHAMSHVKYFVHLLPTCITFPLY